MLARVRTRGKHCALQPSLPSRDFGRVFTSFPNLRDCPLEGRGRQGTRLLRAQNRFCPRKGDHRERREAESLNTAPHPPASCLRLAPYPSRAGRPAVWRRSGGGWARRSPGELGRRHRWRGIEGGRARAEGRGGWRRAVSRCPARHPPRGPPPQPPPPAPRTLSRPATPGPR